MTFTKKPKPTYLELNNDSSKEKKIVVITGVSKGLGRALALELASRGHTVAGCGRSEDKIKTIKEELGLNTNHFFHSCDVSDDEQVQDFANLVEEKVGVPDILINVAGVINRNSKLWEISPESFDLVVDVNIKGPANVIRRFVPKMLKKGTGIIINFSSGWGRSAAAEVAPYCASKWAIEGLTKSLAKELPVGFAAVALNPGVINTDMLQSCFGENAAKYISTEAWAPQCANLVLRITPADNGSSLDAL